MRALLLTLLMTVAAGAQTLTLADSTILQANPHKTGAQLGGVDYYDSGQLLKNLVSTENAGFEPLQVRQIWVQNGAGTSSCQLTLSADPYHVFPAGLLVGSTYLIAESTSAQKGMTGLVTASTAGNGSTAPIYTLGSPCAANLSDGDIVTVTNVQFPTGEAAWESGQNGMSGTVAGGGKITTDSTTPYDGRQSLALDTTAGGSASVTLYFDSNNQDKYVVINGTYRMSFAAKTTSGSPTITYAVTRGATGGVNCSMTPSVTTTWTVYTASCTGTETNTGVGIVSATFTIGGTGKVEIDDAVFQKTSGQIAANTSVFRDELYSTLIATCAGTTGPTCSLRNWTAQNGETLDNWILPALQAAQTAGYSSSVQQGQLTPRLQDYLQLVKVINGLPYLEIPVTFSETEAANLIEFLESTNTASGYGQKRAALGQTAPWVGPGGVFPEIYMTFCNECWNSATFPAANLPFRSGGTQTNLYMDYAIRSGSVNAAMRHSPSFNATATHLGFNVQIGIPFGISADLPGMVTKGGAPDFFEQAPYTMGTAVNGSPAGAPWASALAEPYVEANYTAGQSYALAVTTLQGYNSCGASGTVACLATNYEQNVGTYSTCGQAGYPACTSGANTAITQPVLDALEAAGPQAIIQAQQVLANMQQRGIPVQNLWTVTEFSNTTFAGLTAKIYGSAVDMGGACSYLNAATFGGSYCPRPSMLGLMVANKAIIGPMTNCTMTGAVTYNFAGDTLDGPVPALSSVPYVTAQCFKDAAGNRSIVFTNTSLTTPYTVTLAGTNLPSGFVAVTKFTAPDLTTMNEAASGTPTNLFTATMNTAASTLTAPATVTVPALTVMALNYATTATGIGGVQITGGTTFSGATTLR